MVGSDVCVCVCVLLLIVTQKSFAIYGALHKDFKTLRIHKLSHKPAAFPKQKKWRYNILGLYTVTEPVSIVHVPHYLTEVQLLPHI